MVSDNPVAPFQFPKRYYRHRKGYNMTDDEIIKTIRKGLKLSQTQLAGALNTAFSTVSAWENGRAKPRPDTWRNLAELCAALFFDVEAAERRGAERQSEINSIAALLTARAATRHKEAENAVNDPTGAARAKFGLSRRKDKT